MIKRGMLCPETKYSVTRRALPVLAGFLMMAAWAMGARKPKNDEGPVARLRSAPASARSMKNPFAGNELAAQAGRKLFLRHCAQCHGPEGYGRGRAADLHSADIQSAPPGALFWAIRNGRLRRGMPSWSGLPNQQLWQLVTFIETLEGKSAK
ncbi:MAG TPA: c-type cytochrome [Terriglobia bacterium]|nr:c-type cytochrome [Terriglobia bacterium]